MGKVVKLDSFKSRQLKRLLRAARAVEEKRKAEAAFLSAFVAAIEIYFETGVAPSWPPALRVVH
jgi:hypothetical protein